MTTITIEEDLKLEKTNFKDINEFFLHIHLHKKQKKLSPQEAMKKFRLNKK